MPKTQFITVTEAESGQKLLQYLQRRLKGDVPRSAIQRWIRKGQVRVDKGRKKPFDRIKAGQTVRIPPYVPGASPRSAAKGTLTIVHEEKHILAIAKPAGLAAHGGNKIEDSVAARLTALFPNADFMPTLVHRLDKDTSGLLLVAKDYATLRDLNDRFASGNIDKMYLAWVKGRWSATKTVLLEDHLEKQGIPGKERVRTGSGKVALAKATKLTEKDEYSLVAVRLLTGRTHQIRVQLASRHHPVIGDRKYGKGNNGPMRLHCFAIQVAGTTYTSPPTWKGRWTVPPDALRQARALLRK